MKTRIVVSVSTAILLTGLLATGAAAQDLRDAFQKAQAAREQEEAVARQTEEQILNDRTALLAEVERLEAEQAALEEKLTSTEQYIERTEAKRTDLDEQWERSELDFKEISGNVRLAAKDLEAMLHQSPFTAFDPQRLERVQPLLGQGYFPDIDDIAGMAAVIFEEIKLSGQVSLREGEYVNRAGETATAPVLTLGKFTNAYQAADEIGFLDYSPESHRFIALSRLPSGNTGKLLGGYLAGQESRVPFDMSRGNALRQIIYQTDFKEQLRAGGPLVYPIAALALVALLIILYKLIDLNRVSLGTDRLMDAVQDLAHQGHWEDVDAELDRQKGSSPITQVVREGLRARNEDRETQESVLQEAILSQLPRVERGLSILAVLGAVAPLIGLLGTVTGMIETFRVITLFGTGDPKLMSGGISEALVTTELGLAVAIPIMLMHTLLSRRADRIIGKMEEKAVQLTNILQMHRKRKAMTAVAGG